MFHFPKHERFLVYVSEEWGKESGSQFDSQANKLIGSVTGNNGVFNWKRTFDWNTHSVN